MSAVLFSLLAIHLHEKYLFWDFCAYLLTGKHLIGASSPYSELFRAPLVPLALATLGTSAYFFLSELLLAYASIRFSRRFSLDPVLFYFLLQTPLATVLSVTAGSEVLALALGVLALSMFDSLWGGALLGLAFLARYSMVLYTVPFVWLVLRNADARLLLKQAAVAAAVVSPWLFYNFLTYGNPLASIADFLFLNGAARQYLWHWPNISFLSVLLPTLLLAVPVMRRDLEWWAFAGMVFLSFFVTPERAGRYLLPALPFLAVVASKNIRASRVRSALSLFVVAVSILGSVFAFSASRGLSPAPFVSAAYSLGGCPVVSNAWVPLACVGAWAEPPVDENALRTRALAVYSGFPHPAWAAHHPFAVAAYYGKDYNLFIPERCAPPRPYLGSYLRTYNTLHGTHLTYADELLCAIHLRSC